MRVLIAVVCMLFGVAEAATYTIPVPTVYNQAGAWVDVSGSADARTFILSGAATDSVMVEFETSGGYVSVVKLNGPSSERNVNFAAQKVRARRLNSGGAVTLVMNAENIPNSASVLSVVGNVSSVYQVPSAAIDVSSITRNLTVSYNGCSSCSISVEGSIGGIWAVIGKLTGPSYFRSEKSGFETIRTKRLAGSYSASERINVFGLPSSHRENDWSNVLDFGAKGNGIVDDAPSIQAAASAACTAGHLTVKLPPGSFRVTVPITGSCTLNGIVQGIRFQGDGLRGISQIIVDGTSSTDGIVFSNNVPYGEGGEVSNIWVSAKVSRTSMRDGIRFTNWGHALVENVRVLNGARNGMRLEGVINMTVRRAYMFGNQEGVNVGNRTGGLLNSTTVRLSDLYCSASVANGATFKGDQILCSGCVFESNGAYGLHVTDLYATTLIGPYFEANTDWHLYADTPTNLTVISPFFFGGSKGGAYIKSSSMTTVIGGSFAANVPRTIAIENTAKVTILGTPWNLPVAYEWRTVGDAGSAGPIEAYKHGLIQLYGGGGVFGTSVRFNELAPNAASENTLTYAASMTPDARVGNVFVITASDNAAFTIANPTNPTKGQALTFRIRNGTAGALGTVTWGSGATYRLSAWTQPASGFSRSITFRYNGTVWVEETRTAADVPN